MLQLIKQVFSPAPIINPAQALRAAQTPVPRTQKAMKKVDGVQSVHLKKSDEPIVESVRIAKLIMVTANNNNKFYEMHENKDGTFTATYGRVGSSGTAANYPMSKWDSKYNEKVRKGYKDQTHLFAHVSKDESQHLDISDKTVDQLIQELTRFARKSISYNYMVSAEEVTRKQVEEAQALLDNLVARVKKGMRAKYFNDKLIELFQVIPRRMSRVNDHLINAPKTTKDLKAIEEMLAKEQATLDVMRGQVELNEKQKDTPTKQEKLTLIEAMGLQITPLQDKKLINSIKKMMGTNATNFKRAFTVVNMRTQEQFDTHMKKAEHKKVELFWHGSRNENWLSIMKAGLILRPANAVINGKMFGYGLYFADRFQKSLNYTSFYGSYWTGGSSNKGFLALYDVHVGKQLKIKAHQNWCYQLSEGNLKKRGKNYDSLFAKGGVDLRNNEYIIYNHNQCTIRYLIEVH